MRNVLEFLCFLPEFGRRNAKSKQTKDIEYNMQAPLRTPETDKRSATDKDYRPFLPVSDCSGY